MGSVSEYIKKQELTQREILKKLRKLIKKTFPKIKEEIKMGVPWYEGKFYLVGLRDHVNMGFSVEKMTEKNRKELEGKGEYMRHLKFYKKSEIDEKKIVRLMKLTGRVGI